MHAELTIECDKELPANIEEALAARINKTVEKKVAMAATFWKTASDKEDLVLFCHLFNELVYLVFKPDIQTLKVHIENTSDKTNIRLLKKHIEEVARKFEQFVGYNHNKINRMEVTIWAEQRDFQSGTKQSYFDKLKEGVKSNIGTEIYVPIAAFVISLIRNKQVADSAINAIIAFIAAIFWIALTVWLSKETFSYSEDVRS